MVIGNYTNKELSYKNKNCRKIKIKKQNDHIRNTIDLFDSAKPNRSGRL